MRIGEASASGQARGLEPLSRIKSESARDVRAEEGPGRLFLPLRGLIAGPLI
jgi:hypothetical protein